MLRPEDRVPGTLVECIDATHRDLCRVQLVERRIYTVIGRDGPGVRVNCGNPFGWGLFRFRRPDEERLSIFRAMLVTTPRKESARCR